MLHHHPHQADGGIWHAVYQIPGTTALSSIGDALTERGAKIMCDDANRDQVAKAKAAAAAAIHPADRKIPAGFYTDRDAS